MSPITLDQAHTIVTAALQKAADEGMNSLCVVVLDEGGHVKAVARQDGASFGRVDIARGKAFGAIAFGVNSATLEQMALGRGHFVAGAATALGGDLVPVAGGVVVVDGDENRVGAVGISGDSSDNDEIAALAGIEAAGLQASDN